MHWNSMRYCIGLPPERWYEIADSLGFLIQNEYPIWTSVNNTKKIYPGLTGNNVANEFKAWMSDHWNHPSVVIWDAQNESVTQLTEEAIKLVRGMDLSDRPWENGWSTPDRDSDPIESHPYLFMKYRNGEIPSRQGSLADNMQIVQLPFNDVNDHNRAKDKPRYSNPIIINEYEWLWLNRDGSTTTLTDKVYDAVFGKDLTKEQRIYLSTRYIGMITEYWRAHRMCAGVLHFCGLGYSRPVAPRGQTSDNFIDIKNLIFEPQYVKYVKPSFAPVGLMINFWDNFVNPNFKKNVEIYTVNDLDVNWSGPITFNILKGEKVISKQVKDITVPALGRIITNFPVEMNGEKGAYRLEVEINLNGEQVKSIREFTVE